MKWMAYPVLLIMLLAAAVVFAGQLQWGAVVFSFGDTQWTMAFIVFVFFMIGAFIVVRLLGVLFGLPFRMLQMRRYKRLMRLRKEFEQGVALYLQGQWGQARKRLLRGAREPSLAHTANLLAARCAAEDHHFEAARASLQAAREADARDDFCAPLIQSEILLRSGHAQQAAEHLAKLKNQRPDNRRVADLLIQACAEMNDWKVLRDALPRLRKLYANQPDKLRAAEIPVATELLQRAAERMDEAILERQWRATGATIKPVLLTDYAKMLVDIGAHGTAERLLRKEIESKWDVDCMVYYGGIEGGDVDMRLKHAESWLKSRPQDPALLLCLGKLYCQAELWDQARHYLKASFSLEPKVETFQELTSVLDYIGGGGID